MVPLRRGPLPGLWPFMDRASSLPCSLRNAVCLEVWVTSFPVPLASHCSSPDCLPPAVPFPSSCKLYTNPSLSPSPVFPSVLDRYRPQTNMLYGSYLNVERSRGSTPRSPVTWSLTWPLELFRKR